METSPMRILLIINPISGIYSKSGLNAAIEKRIKNMGHEITTKYTECPGDATRIAREAVIEGYDAVLACGGDGTVNETAKGLLHSGVALGILPNGSGNGLARHLNIPPDPLMSLKTIKEHNIVDCDYCTVNDVPFFCTFGIGFDAAVSRRFARSRRRGLITYLKSAVDEYLKFNPETYVLNVGDQSIKVNAFLIACCNASQYGNNAYIAPTASITDGLLDITLMHSGNAISQALIGVDLLAGSITKGGLIDTFRTRSVTIERSKAGIVHIDGESSEMGKSLVIECHHGGLKIFSPVKPSHFKPIYTPTTLFFRDLGITISRFFNRQ